MAIKQIEELTGNEECCIIQLIDFMGNEDYGLSFIQDGKILSILLSDYPNEELIKIQRHIQKELEKEDVN